MQRTKVAYSRKLTTPRRPTKRLYTRRYPGNSAGGKGGGASGGGGSTTDYSSLTGDAGFE